MGKEAFIKNAALLCLIADVLNLIYVNFYWFQQRFTPQFIRTIFQAKGIDTASMTNTTILQYKYLLISSVSNVLIIFLGVHAFIYFLFIKKVRWPAKYIGGYCLSAVILTGLELFLFRNSLSSWSLLLMFTALLYFIIFKGIKFLKIQEQ